MRYPSFGVALRKFKKNVSTMSSGERKILEDAYDIAELAHAGQKKFGLYPYIIHSLSVFNFLFEKLRVRDCQLLAASLLHDVVEDAGISFGEIKRRFGRKTHDIVKTVTRIPNYGETEFGKEFLKMRHFEEVVCRGSYEAKILGIADKYDNVRRAPLIPQSSAHWEKIPRWIKETEAFLELAESVDADAYIALKTALGNLKRFQKKKVKM